VLIAPAGAHEEWRFKTRSLAVASKADRTAYVVQYSCRTEPPKFLHLEWPWLRDHATRGYPRHENFGGSVATTSRTDRWTDDIIVIISLLLRNSKIDQK